MFLVDSFIMTFLLSETLRFFLPYDMPFIKVFVCPMCMRLLNFYTWNMFIPHKWWRNQNFSFVYESLESFLKLSFKGTDFDVKCFEYAIDVNPRSQVKIIRTPWQVLKVLKYIAKQLNTQCTLKIEEILLRGFQTSRHSSKSLWISEINYC